MAKGPFLKLNVEKKNKFTRKINYEKFNFK